MILKDSAWESGSSIFATIEPRLCYLRFVSEISMDDWEPDQAEPGHESMSPA